MGPCSWLDVRSEKSSGQVNKSPLSTGSRTLLFEQDVGQLAPGDWGHRPLIHRINYYYLPLLEKVNEFTQGSKLVSGKFEVETP